MPYNSTLAFTNAQMRNQGIQTALENFMSYFQSMKAQKELADKEAKQKAIGDASQQLSGLQAKAAPVQGAGALNTAVQGLQSQIPGASNPTPQPLGPGVAGPLPAGPSFSPLNPAINPDAVKAGAAQEADLAPQIASRERTLAQAKADYLNKYGPEGSAYSAEDMMTEDALKKEKLAQAKGATKSQDLGNQLNAGLLSSRIQSGQTEAAKGALDLSTAQQTQGADIAAKNLAPQEGSAKIGLMGAQSNEANAKAAKDNADAAAGGDVKTIAAIERQAKTRFDQAGKETNYDTAKDNWKNIQSAYAKSVDPNTANKGASDYTLLEQALKLNNPGAIVRSSNMDSYIHSMGLSDQMTAKFLSVAHGGVFDNKTRSSVRDMAEQIYQNHENSYRDKLNSIAQSLDATPGANRERVFGKDVNAWLTGDSQPGSNGLSKQDADLINKYKPKAANAGQ